MNKVLSDQFLFVEFNQWSDFVVVAFLLALIAQLVYYLGIFSRFAFTKVTEDLNENFEPVSVIICAKNERENLLHFLPEFLAQDYPIFEVIVVNDNSVDDTSDVLKAYSLQYPNLKIVTIPDNDRFYGSKKFALTLGIKAAQYENILLTDADCKPVSSDWIKTMSSCTKEKEIVLGFGAYQKLPGLLNKLIRFETLFTAIQYFSLALCKMPYMGVGRNLGYKKELFFKVKGFSKHQHILSGDDDLFVNEVANKTNTAIVFIKKSHTLSLPKTTFSAWLKQKKRHLSTGKFYKFKHQLVLGLYPFTLLLLVSSFIVLIITQTSLYLILVLLLIRYLIQMLTFKFSIDKLGGKDLLLLTPFFELFYLFFQPILIISNFVKKNSKWS
jgi:cellulose synthase/poly-beta-1,6-N-acetylglucosamine synthase-like glycosyltransferase